MQGHYTDHRVTYLTKVYHFLALFIGCGVVQWLVVWQCQQKDKCSIKWTIVASFSAYLTVLTVEMCSQYFEVEMDIR